MVSRMVGRFVQECLEGDWNRLLEVNPAGFYDPHSPIANSSLLRCPGRSFDCDDCELSRAICREVWGLEAPDFRGDTMNSFRTVFGRERIATDVTDVPWAYDGSAADERFELPKELKDGIRDFNWMYHTIGNFIPLPNVKVDGKSLNTYRSGVWKDYFGSFLAAVKVYLEGGCESSRLPELFVRLMDANGFFWECYRGRFDEYVRDFFLEKYLDGEGRVIELPMVYYWNRKMTATEYVHAAERYLDFANAVIADRGERIVSRLLVEEI